MKHYKRLLALSLVAALFIAFIPALYAQEMDKININKASAQEITQLKRIGPAYAERIVKYRTESGPFQSPEDIMKVPGIGPKTYEDNKDRITVE